MKLWVFSDLHLEFDPLPDAFVVPEADVCVVAGDVLTRGVVPSLHWLDEHVAPLMPVVFVAGNHEFYSGSLVEGLAAARQFTGSGRVHFLENSSVRLGDVTFCGATLWTDFELLGKEWADLAVRSAAENMRDYSAVAYTQKPYARLRPAHTYRKHGESRRFLEECLVEHGGGKLVFVTHHAPSMRSVEKRYRDDVLTPAFASDLDTLMGDHGPDLWLHGHVHHRCQYADGRTRVLCNPRGYPGEASAKGFDFGLVVEV